MLCSRCISYYTVHLIYCGLGAASVNSAANERKRRFSFPFLFGFKVPNSESSCLGSNCAAWFVMWQERGVELLLCLISLWFEVSLESCIILWKLALRGHLRFCEEILECREVDVDFKAEVECYVFLRESSLLYK
jgi:hypothetical protein